MFKDMTSGFERILDREFGGPEGRADLEARVRTIRAAAELTAALAALREAQALPKTRLAELLGRHPSAISRLLRSRTANPSVRSLLEIVEALGVYLKVEVIPQPKEQKERHAPVEITLPGRTRDREAAAR